MEELNKKKEHIELIMDLSEATCHHFLDKYTKYDYISVVSERANISRNIYIKYDKKGKDQDISLFLRNKEAGGGRAGNKSQHACSVKVEAPYNGVTITVPSKDEVKKAQKEGGQEAARDLFKIEGKVPSKYKDTVNIIKDFLIENIFDINNIYYTEKEYSAIESHGRILKRRDNTYTKHQASPSDSEDEIETVYKIKRGIK